VLSSRYGRPRREAAKWLLVRRDWIRRQVTASDQCCCVDVHSRCEMRSYIVASPGFVARRGKDWNYVMVHSRWTSGPGAAAARWVIVLWICSRPILIERAVNCWHLHQLISHSQTTQYLDSWLSDLEVEGGGARAPVPHSWRRHWSYMHELVPTAWLVSLCGQWRVVVVVDLDQWEVRWRWLS